MEKNYYEVLGIDIEATDSEIKSAFRRCARKYHPDVAGDTPEAVSKFKEINEAYEVLSNPQKRKKYDTIRGILKNTSTVKNKENRTTNTKKATPSSETHKNKEQHSNQNTTKNNSEKNKFQDAWETFMKKTKQADKSTQTKYNEKKINGSDITSEITINVTEAIQGTTRTINILHTEPCPKCHGRKFSNGSICNVCHNSGELSDHKKLSVKIPSNIKQGAKIRISGEGNPGVNGGNNGDLYLIINILTENSSYTYDGLNILQTIPVEPYEAVLGNTIEVKTPNGNITMKLASGTTNGQKYRLAKQGLTKNGKTGDMIITISIEIPKNLSKEEILFYEKLRQLSKRNIREHLYD